MSDKETQGPIPVDRQVRLATSFATGFVSGGGRNELTKPRYIPDEIIISPNPEVAATATQEEKERELTNLLMGLTDAIRIHGCEVDISDPENIRVKRPRGNDR